MKSFLKYTLASMLGIIIASVILFFILMGGIGAAISSSSDKTVTVENNSILKVSLNKQIVDRGIENPLAQFDIPYGPKANMGLNQILKNLKKAAKDDKIKGIYLDISAIPSGIASLDEVRNALLKFKESGKFIIAYSNFYTQKSYYLATVADKIYLHPQGGLDFKGLSSEIMFYTEALKKVGVEPQIIRHGKFKSAVEPFMLTEMSKANREQTETFMFSIWNSLIEGISTQRGIPVEKLNEIADGMLIENPQAALDHKMVDGLKYYDEIMAELIKLSEIDEDEPEFIGLASYTNAPETTNPETLPKDKIAVVFASGEIKDGEGDDETIGGDGMAKAIREARLDSTVKAVVLRVNSPGGSALASDIIWREVILTKKVKPIIASMGDVAASGGYYISCATDRIVAGKNTITGSIGVFGLMFSIQELITEKIGIHLDGVKTNEHADIGSMYRPLSPDERAIIQKGVVDVYKTFIGHVAEGRGMTTADVDSIGQGRVWSGINAMDIGLIDEYGGLERAIEIAKNEANLEDYRIEEYPKRKKPIEELLEGITGKAKASIIEEELGSSYKYYKELKEVKSRSGILTRMPADIEIY